MAAIQESPDNALFQPPFMTYATFRLAWLDDIIFSQQGCQGVKFFPAWAVVDGHNYRSVLAVGIDNNGRRLTSGDNILYDDVPCPPDCHISGIQGINSPTYLRLNLYQAQQKLIAPAFAAQFSNDDIDALANAGAEKIRIFYAWTEGNGNIPTFLILGADDQTHGDNIPDIYLHDPIPESQAQL